MPNSTRNKNQTRLTLILGILSWPKMIKKTKLIHSENKKIKPDELSKKSISAKALVLAEEPKSEDPINLTPLRDTKTSSDVFIRTTLTLRQLSVSKSKKTNLKRCPKPRKKKSWSNLKRSTRPNSSPWSTPFQLTPSSSWLLCKTLLRKSRSWGKEMSKPFLIYKWWNKS